MHWEYEWDAARKDTRLQLLELREMESICYACRVSCEKGKKTAEEKKI